MNKLLPSFKILVILALFFYAFNARAETTPNDFNQGDVNSVTVTSTFSAIPDETQCQTGQDDPNNPGLVIIAQKMNRTIFDLRYDIRRYNLNPDGTPDLSSYVIIPGTDLFNGSDFLKNFEGRSIFCTDNPYLGTDAFIQRTFQLINNQTFTNGIVISVSGFQPGYYIVLGTGSEITDPQSPDGPQSNGPVTSAIYEFGSFTIRAAPTPTPTPTGTIIVQSRDQAGNALDTTWDITGPENLSGIGPSGVYNNKPTGSYSIFPASLSCYSSPSYLSPQTLNADSSITFTLTYTYNCNPSVDITADDTNVAHNGETTIRWTSQYTSSCSVSPGDGSGTSGSFLSGKLKFNESPYTWTATCTGTNGAQVQDTVTVTVGNVPSPTVDISAASTNIAYNSSTTISWSSTNSASCNITPDNWTGTSGSQNSGNLTSSRTYTATCTGTNGAQVQDTVTVTVGSSPTMQYFRCNGVNSPGTCSIAYSGTAGITWSSSNTTICSLVATDASNGSNIYDINVAPSGSRNDDNITANRNYSIECWDGNTDVHAPALPLPLIVSVNGPSVDIKARQHGSGGYSDGPISIAWNSTVDLDWTSSNTSTCIASGDWSGSQSTSGNTQTGNLNQVRQYTYTLTCNGNGSSADTVLVNVSAPNPNSPPTVNVLHPDAGGTSSYCNTGPGAYVSWTYSDPSGSPQSAYEVEVDDSGSFSNPEVDTGKVISTSANYTTGSGYLAFNTTYRARVRVWNGYDQVSGWTTSSSFKTPNFAYPQVEFNWSPVPPQAKKNAQFNDQTIFYDGNPNGRIWSWVFGDGGSSSTQNPVHIYQNPGSYQVTLTATDNANQVCSKTKAVNIQRQVPRWLEIAPR